MKKDRGPSCEFVARARMAHRSRKTAAGRASTVPHRHVQSKTSELQFNQK
jgi:hypothetical protein